MYWILVFIILLNPNFLQPCITTEITTQVFGNNIQILPAAFGDFNSDELTDLFVLRNNSKTVEILLGSNEAIPLLKAGNLKCSFALCSITSVVPGDFNGDAFMDVLVTTKCPQIENISVHVLWGGQNYLNCSFDERKPILSMRGEPLAIDCNNDFIIDLFGVNNDRLLGIWIFSNNSQPVFQKFGRAKRDNYKMRDPHSNAYLDLNNDNIADLFLTVQSQEFYEFEIWHGLHKKSTFSLYKNFLAPQQARRKLGQSLFLDLELEGKMDLVVPVLDKSNPKILVYAKDKWNDLEVHFKNEDKTWYFLEFALPFSKAVTLRGGDYNMDGYPDLLATLTTGNINRTFLFENVPCRTTCESFSRSFQIQWNGFSKNINDSVAGIFYDIFRDGILDVILIRQFRNGSYYVAAIKNNLDYDANFIKVMVLAGLTHKNDSNLKAKKNAYGTNLPGPRVAYQTVDQEGFVRIGVSAQLPQSAYYSLHLPYVMFALGRTPNFVDHITVGFASEHRDLPQVIPNSQMVVIPVQIDNPSKWKVQLFVTPSKIIVLSAGTLIGTCCFIIFIIFFLHWKEKKSDRLERLQEVHRFNFDAM